MGMTKAALLKAIAGLDAAGVEAIYNTLAAHVEDERMHVETLQEELEAGRGDASEVARAAKALESCAVVVEAYEQAMFDSIS